MVLGCFELLSSDKVLVDAISCLALQNSRMHLGFASTWQRSTILVGAEIAQLDAASE